MTTDEDKAALRDQQLLRRVNKDWHTLMTTYEDFKGFYCRSQEDQDAMGTAMDEVERVAHALSLKNELPGTQRDEEGTQGYEFVVERFKCGSCREGSNWHTRDEVILRASGDMSDAIDAIPELTEENAEALHTVRGGILHALDELQLLGIKGFKHPDEPVAEKVG